MKYEIVERYDGNTERVIYTTSSIERVMRKTTELETRYYDICIYVRDNMGGVVYG